MTDEDIARLKASQEAEAAEGRVEAIAAGRHWAEKRAGYHQLKRIVRIKELLDQTGGFNKGELLKAVVEAISGEWPDTYTVRDLAERLTGDEHDDIEDEQLEAFLEGAAEAWAEYQERAA